MLTFIFGQTQLYRSCIFGVFNTTTCFSCPYHPSSGRSWTHKKSEGERPVLTSSRYKVVI